MVDVGETLEKWGGILVGGVGDKVLVGIILGMLQDTTPGVVYQCIVTNQNVSQLSDADWQKYQGFGKKAHIEQLDWDRFIINLRHQFQKRRPDLYGILDNMPDNQGWTWLDTQITLIKSKLGC